MANSRSDKQKLERALEIQDLKIIENPTLVREHALDKLRRGIETGLFPPGHRLVERELCEALGVSRTSVREALRQLQSENLIEVGPRRNISVAVVTAEDAHDIYMLRELIEPRAMVLLVERNDQPAIKQLGEIIKRMKKAIAKRDLPQCATIAGEFYEAVLRGSGSKVIYDTGSQLMKRVSYLRLKSLSVPGRLGDGFEEWNVIMEAVASGDPARAAEALAAHIRNARVAILASIANDNERLNAAR
jgi:DNA-binding GntR family transcriptional regulator